MDKREEKQKSTISFFHKFSPQYRKFMSNKQSKAIARCRDKGGKKFSFLGCFRFQELNNNEQFSCCLRHHFEIYLLRNENRIPMEKLLHFSFDAPDAYSRSRRIAFTLNDTELILPAASLSLFLSPF